MTAATSVIDLTVLALLRAVSRVRTVFWFKTGC